MSELEIKQAIHSLKKANFKYTDKRSAMLIFFIKNNRYLTAKDIHNFMRSKFPSISYDTVFRNLKVFEETNIIESVEKQGEKIYRFRRVAYRQQQQRFVCTECGSSELIQVFDFDYFAEKLPDYLVDGYRLELYGKCVRCRKQEAWKQA